MSWLNGDPESGSFYNCFGTAGATGGIPITPAYAIIQLISKSVNVSSSSTKLLIMAQVVVSLSATSVIYATIGRSNESSGTGAINLANPNGTTYMSTSGISIINNHMSGQRGSLNGMNQSSSLFIVDTPGSGTWWYSVWICSTVAPAATARNGTLTILQVTP